MLGQVQHKWLIEGVRNTDAEFVFIVSSVPWVMPHTGYHVRKTLAPKGDSFVMFLKEREMLLEVLDGFDIYPREIQHERKPGHYSELFVCHSSNPNLCGG